MQMNEREMLELAAKAAGIVGQYVYYDDDGFPPIIGIKHLPRKGSAHVAYWNPLTSSGDCADMEAELELDVRWTREGVLVEPIQEHIYAEYEKFSDHNGDKKKARRYASTRAAAAIGKAMP